MTFGNLGEKYELLSMKAAGIPLLRIIRPLIILCVLLSCTSFYFQNVIAPKAQMQLWTLLVSMKQTSPELDIPEGVFYSDIEGYNIYVKKKDRETGIMKDLLIYDLSDGFDNTHIIWAAEGSMETTVDKQNLYLHLYDGEQFENLKSQSIDSKNVPYRRETFREKHIMIDFDGGFNMVDGGYLGERSDSKNMIEISHSIDSLSFRADSIGTTIFKEMKNTTYRDIPLNKGDSIFMAERNLPDVINSDSLYNTYTLAEKEKTLRIAADRLDMLVSDWKIKSIQMNDTDNNIRRHQIDWHKKITLSLSCLIFFFIGAPLGAIIRKGGLGLPVVISVIIFVLYYIVDSGSTRVARSGEMNMILGVWMSTLVLAPLGAFFTYKSNKDSVVFNLEVYINFFRWLLGLRPSRHITKKEVIIKDADYAYVYAELTETSKLCETYLDTHQIFTNDGPSNAIADISDKIEKVIEELSNSKDRLILNWLNDFPILSTQAHKSPSDHRWLNILLGICFPIGLFFYFRIWMFGLRLEKDLNKIIQNNINIKERIKNQSLDI